MLYDVTVDSLSSLSRSFDSYPDAVCYVLDLLRIGYLTPCQICINVSKSSKKSFNKEK